MTVLPEFVGTPGPTGQHFSSRGREANGKRGPKFARPQGPAHVGGFAGRRCDQPRITRIAPIMQFTRLVAPIRAIGEIRGPSSWVVALSCGFSARRRPKGFGRGVALSGLDGWGGIAIRGLTAHGYPK